MNQVFKTSTGFKVGCWIMALICAVFIVMLPFSIAMVWLAHVPFVRVSDDRIVIKWFGTREHLWTDIASIQWVRGGGMIGGLMRPLGYGLHSKPKANPRIAIGAHAGGDELFAIIKQKTGLEPT